MLAHFKTRAKYKHIHLGIGKVEWHTNNCVDSLTPQVTELEAPLIFLQLSLLQYIPQTHIYLF